MEIAVIFTIGVVLSIVYRIGYDRGETVGFRRGGDAVERGYQMERDESGVEMQERGL